MTGTTRIVTVKADFNKKYCTQKLTLLELEGYKKTFQNFWVQFVEQFVPATTIFVSGEKWCNRPDEICEAYQPCDFDFEFVEGDVTVTPNLNIFNVNPPTSRNSGDVGSSDGSNSHESLPPTAPRETTEDGPIFSERITIIPIPAEDGEIKMSPSVINNTLEREKRKKEYLNKISTTETIIE